MIYSLFLKYKIEQAKLVLNYTNSANNTNTTTGSSNKSNTTTTGSSNKSNTTTGSSNMTSTNTTVIFKCFYLIFSMKRTTYI